MFNRFFSSKKLEVSIIACGDTGQAIGVEIMAVLGNLGKKLTKTLAINSGRKEHKKTQYFSSFLSIADDHEGFARDLDAAQQFAELKRQDIQSAISKIMPSKEGILLILTGAGATGTACALLAIDIVKSEFNRTPPIMTLLPEEFESSRVQYNAAQLFYRVRFADDAYGNPIILLDNRVSYKEFTMPFSTVANKRITQIPNAIANMFYAAFAAPINDEYNASFADLYDVLHTNGISVVVSEILSDDSGEMLNTRFVDIVTDSVMTYTSLSRERILQSRKTFCAVLNAKMKQFQFKIEANKFLTSFERKPNLVFIDTGDEQKIASLSAIVSGLPLPPRIVQILKTARDSRKRIIYEESREYDTAVFDIDSIVQQEEALENYVFTSEKEK